jgi:two-component system, chemotaxis family, protein-glutamate methylesterase/glutaminase
LSERDRAVMVTVTSMAIARRRDVIVIGGSAGALEALKTIVSELPPDIDASIFVVLHSSPTAPSRLAEILQGRTTLPVRQAEDGDRIERRTVVVARPDYHLLLERDNIRTARGPRENRHRPAIDALFRSAAYSHGGRVIATLLSGALDDGTAGLWAVRDRDGIAIVQDPEEAQFPSMPQSALRYAGADHVVRIAQMGSLFERLTLQAIEATDKPVSRELEVEIQISKEGRALQAGVMNLGEITPYTCPECHGVLVALKQGGVPRFRCHTGHAYSLNNLLAEVTELVEAALWGALRSIEESSMLLEHLTAHFRSSETDPKLAGLFEAKARDTLRLADMVRKSVLEHQTLSVDNVQDVKSPLR